MTQNTNTATVNIDALILAGVFNPLLARKLAAKIEWYAEEVEQLQLHRNGAPSFRLAELEDETEYVHRSANAAKAALIELNRSYKERTGRYIIQGMIQGFDNLTVILDDIVAM